MNISTSCFLVSINWISQSPLLTWSLIKWWQISMCFVLECWIWFLVRLITLLLSQAKAPCYPSTQNLLVVVWSKESEHNSYPQLCIQLLQLKVPHKLVSCYAKIWDLNQEDGKSHLCIFCPAYTLQNQNQNNEPNV